MRGRLRLGAMISNYLAAVNSPMVLIEECAGLSVEELVDKGFSDRVAARDNYARHEDADGRPLRGGRQRGGREAGVVRIV